MDISDVALGYGLRAAEKDTTPDKLIKRDAKAMYQGQREFRDRYPVASLASNFVPYLGAALSVDDMRNSLSSGDGIGIRDVVDLGVSTATTKLGIKGVAEAAADLVSRGAKGMRAATNMYGMAGGGTALYGGSYVADQLDANRKAADEQRTNDEAQEFMDSSAERMYGVAEPSPQRPRTRARPKIPTRLMTEPEKQASLQASGSKQTGKEEPPAMVFARSAAEKAGLPEQLAVGIVFAETSGGKNLTNPRSSARGPYQILRGTFNDVNQKMFDGELDWDNLEHTAIAGATYLKEQLDRFGNENLAMAAHYIGPSKVRTLLSNGGMDALMRYKPRGQVTVGEYIRRATSELG